MPGHPLRRRRRHRAHLPLQPAHQGAAAADRADLAGQRQPAGRAAAAASPTASASGSTPRRTTSQPAGVHRPRDPAHQPGLGHPADDLARARRHRPLPVRRRRRTPARSPTACGCSRSCRPSTPRSSRPAPRTRLGRATRPHGSLARLPVDPRLARMVIEAGTNGCAARGARHRRGPVDPGPARAADGQAGSRPTQSHARFADEHSDFVSLLNLWAYLKEQQKELSRQRVPPHVQARVPALPADPRVAGPAQPAAQGAPVQVGLDLAGSTTSGRGRRRPRSTSRCSPGCSRTSALRDEREARVPRRARRPLRHLARARRCSGSSRSG